MGGYCAISLNSAGHVTHYMPAKILNLAHGGNDCYIHIFLADFYDFLRFLKLFLQLLFMVSALGQNDHYNRYISVFLERLLHITAELIEMVQYRAWQTIETNACLVQWLFTLTYSCLVRMLNLGFDSSSSIFSMYKQLLNLIYWLG